MSELVGVAGMRPRRRQTRRRYTKGYSKGRRAYDARRRGAPLDAVGRVYKGVVLCDPCAYCSVRLGTGRGEQPAADHIVPLEGGGANSWENLGAVCRSCNAAKGGNSVLSMMIKRLDG